MQEERRHAVWSVMASVAPEVRWTSRIDYGTFHFAPDTDLYCIPTPHISPAKGRCLVLGYSDRTGRHERHTLRLVFLRDLRLVRLQAPEQVALLDYSWYPFDDSLVAKWQAERWLNDLRDYITLHTLAHMVDNLY